MKRGGIILILTVIFASLLSPLSLAHEDFNQTRKVCPPESCPDAEGLIAGREFETLLQQPTFALKAAYFADHFVFPNLFLLLSIITLIVFVASTFYLYRTSWKKKSWMKVLYSVLSLALTLIILYSLLFYYSAGAESGIVVCDNAGNCNIAMHIHAHIDAEVCGEDIYFPLEKGNLGGQHTHKERNLAHWHNITGINPQTRELFDPEIFSVKEFLRQMKYELPQNCGTKPANLTLKVNGVEKVEGLDYPWKDKDEIILRLE